MTSPSFHYQDSKQELNANCIRDNGKKFLELREKYGDCISMISIRTPQFSSEKGDELIRGLAKDRSVSKNYRFHIVIHNAKKDQYIDVANGRCCMMSRTDYQRQQEARCRTGYTNEYSSYDVWDTLQINKDNGNSDIDNVVGIVCKWWEKWGW